LLDIKLEFNFINEYLSNITSNFNTIIIMLSDYFNCYLMRNYMITGDPFYDIPHVNQGANNILYSLDNNDDNNQDDTDNNDAGDSMQIDSENENNSSRSFVQNTIEKARLINWHFVLEGNKRKRYDDSDSESDSESDMSDGNDFNEPAEKTKLKDKVVEKEGKLNCAKSDLNNVIIQAKEDRAIVIDILNKHSEERPISASDGVTLAEKVKLNIENKEKYERLSKEVNIAKEELTEVKNQLSEFRRNEIVSREDTDMDDREERNTNKRAKYDNNDNNE
jgi:hypothetical protein